MHMIYFFKKQTKKTPQISPLPKPLPSECNFQVLHL